MWRREGLGVWLVTVGAATAAWAVGPATPTTRPTNEGGPAAGTGSASESSGSPYAGASLPDSGPVICSVPGFPITVSRGPDTCLVTTGINVVPMPTSCPPAYELRIDAKGLSDRCVKIAKPAASVVAGSGETEHAAQAASASPSAAPAPATEATRRCTKDPECRSNEVCRAGKCIPKS